jgi:SpoIVB peptidase S55
MMTRPHDAGFHPSRVSRVSRGEPVDHERRGRPSRQRPSNDLVSPRILRFLVFNFMLSIVVAPVTASPAATHAASPAGTHAETPVAASAPPIATFPAAEIHPGLHGVARTVFEGDHLEEFEVEFLGVLKNAIGPQQDMILARLHGTKVEFTGVVAGMSGSPVYVDGRLVGALSYRLGSFAKEPIAGITPIADMIRLSSLGTAAPARAAANRPGDVLGWVARGADRSALPALPGVRPALERASDGSGLEPIGTPLVCAGCDPSTLRYYAPGFEILGMEPTAGGGSGSAAANAVAGPLVPGSAIGAELAGGDLSLAAIGTLTHVDGGRVYAFGHQFTGFGPVEIPMKHAEVLLTLASAAGSFKIANATTSVGTVVEDGLTAIVGEVGRVAPTLALEVRVEGHGATRAFHYDVVRDRTLAPMIVSLTTANSLVRTTDFDASATAWLHCRIALKGRPDVTFEDLYAGTNPGQPVHLLLANDVGGILGLLSNNPFEDAGLSGMSADVKLLSAAQIAQISSLSASRGEVRPGEMFRVTATIAAYRGKDRDVVFDVTLPEDTPSGEVQIVVGGAGAMDGLDRRLIDRQLAQAGGLDDIIRLIGRQRRSNAIYLRVSRRAPTAIIRSDLMPELPLSVFNVFNNPRLSADATLLLESPIVELSRDVDLATVGGRRISLKVK